MIAGVPSAWPATLNARSRSEQDRAGIHDPGHFAYPTYAKAAMQRAENLQRSADDLRVQLESATSALAEAFEEMKKIELARRTRSDARARGGECARAGRGSTPSA